MGWRERKRGREQRERREPHYYTTSLHLQQDRIAREHMIAEQNRAYQESLDADREKVYTCSLVLYMYRRLGYFCL